MSKYVRQVRIRPVIFAVKSKNEENNTMNKLEVRAMIKTLHQEIQNNKNKNEQLAQEINVNNNKNEQLLVAISSLENFSLEDPTSPVPTEVVHAPVLNTTSPKKVMREQRAERTSNAQKNYWAKMTPTERRAECRRRFQVRQLNKLMKQQKKAA